MKKIYINLIGTDGSGKTSISERLLNKLGQDAIMIWCGSESVLMKPLRFILRYMTKSRAEDKKNVNYNTEVERKKKIASKSPFLTKIYIFLIILDYQLQYKIKMWSTRGASQVVLDRYFFDVAVNLATRLGWDTDQLIDFIEKKLHLFHLPEVRVWVKVPATTSMERKDDIPDIKYIEIRLEYYQRIAQRFGFAIVDGHNEIESNAALILSKVKAVKSQSQIMYVHSNNEDVGGADFCMFRLANEFKLKGKVITVALRLNSYILDSYRKNGIPVFTNPFFRPQLSRGLVSILLLPFKSVLDVIYFLRLFANQTPDIVHVNDLYDFAPAFAAKLLGITVIYHIRMIRTNRYETLLFSNLVNIFSSYSVSVSTPVRDHYFDNSKFDKSKHLVIHDWPNDTLVEGKSPIEAPQGLPADKINVVMVGRLEYWKGQHVFLSAIKEINQLHGYTDVQFSLVGGRVVGSEKQAYSDKVISDAKQIDNVVFLGPRNDVPDILRFADISVHASTSPDPFPGVVLESLLSGSATIAARAGGIPEMIRDGTDGLLFKPSDSNDLSKKIISLIESEDLRNSLSKSGRDRILELTNKDKLISQFNHLYEISR